MIINRKQSVAYVLLLGIHTHLSTAAGSTMSDVDVICTITPNQLTNAVINAEITKPEMIQQIKTEDSNTGTVTGNFPDANELENQINLRLERIEAIVNQCRMSAEARTAWANGYIQFFTGIKELLKTPPAIMKARDGTTHITYNNDLMISCSTTSFTVCYRTTMLALTMDELKFKFLEGVQRPFVAGNRNHLCIDQLDPGLIEELVKLYAKK